MSGFDFEVKNVPVFAKTDVLVVGSGTAGIAAAVQAARCGVKTLLVERYGCLGGALSVSNVSSYSFSVNRFPKTLSGIPKEIDKRCRAYGASSPDYRGEGIFVDSELYKCMLDEWMAEEGVEVMLHTTVIGAYVNEGVVRGVFCHSKSGIGIILAKSTVDASGDGDVAAYAGAEFTKREKEKLQPTSVVFGISDIDVEKFKKHFQAPGSEGFAKVFDKAAAMGEWKSPKRGGAWKILTQNGDVKSLNLTLIRETDGTDVFDLTRAEIEGRKQIMHIISLFRKYGKDIGLGDCKLRTIAPQLGLRETRRIVGEYSLCGEDVRQRRSFDDGIGRLICTIDLYGETKTNYIPLEAETFSVPFRALVPKKIDGIVVAGRCVSCDDTSFGALRLMVGCALTGQAAGMASALAVRNGVKVRDTDVKELQNELKKSGVILD